MEKALNNTAFDVVGFEKAASTVSFMKERGSAARGFVICGEKGLGKKTLAQYIAAILLCRGDTSGGRPCGHCLSCMKILSSSHPDFIKITPSLESGSYKLEDDLRAVVSDAPIAPNESDYKVYLIADMDKTPQGFQNALLKLIEEPPAHAAIILTASSKEYFLPTILSRTLCLPVSPVTEDECRQYLKAHTQSEEADIDRAVGAMGGNIGMCLEFLNGKALPETVDLTRDIAEAVAEKNEYELLRLFWTCEKNKDLSLTVLKLLRNVIRDASLSYMGCDARRIGCDEKASKALSDSLSGRQLTQLCEMPEKYISRINSNGNLTLCLHALCADIKRVTG